MEQVNRFKSAVTAALGVLTALWGWFGWLVLAWIGAMALDTLTGMAAAAKAGEWRSKKAREGLWHKAGCVTAVGAAGLLDMVIGDLLAGVPGGMPFTYTVLLCPLTTVWYLLTEIGSIIENAGSMGAPVPEWLRKAVAALRDKVDNEM